MRRLTPAQERLLAVVTHLTADARRKGDKDGWFDFHDVFYHLTLPKYLEAVSAGRTWDVLVRAQLVEDHPTLVGYVRRKVA